MASRNCVPRSGVCPLRRRFPGWLALVAICHFIIPCVAAKDLFKSNRYGYSLDIPERWHKIPDAVKDTFTGQLLANPGSITFDAGFQQAGKTPFAYPYVLVQILRYGDFGIRRQPYERELKGIFEAATTIPSEAAVMNELSSEARSLISKPKIVHKAFDREKRTYDFDLQITMPQFGKVYGRARGFFGRHAIVQVMYYDLADKWTDDSPERDLFLNSFRFAADHAFVPGDPSVLTSISESPIFRGALAGGIFGAVCAALVRRRRGVKPAG